jgi:hypothetical protein
MVNPSSVRFDPSEPAPASSQPRSAEVERNPVKKADLEANVSSKSESKDDQPPHPAPDRTRKQAAKTGGVSEWKVRQAQTVLSLNFTLMKARGVWWRLG